MLADLFAFGAAVRVALRVSMPRLTSNSLSSVESSLLFWIRTWRASPPLLDILVLTLMLFLLMFIPLLVFDSCRRWLQLRCIRQLVNRCLALFRWRRQSQTLSLKLPQLVRLLRILARYRPSTLGRVTPATLACFRIHHRFVGLLPRYPIVVCLVRFPRRQYLRFFLPLRGLLILLVNRHLGLCHNLCPSPHTSLVFPCRPSIKRRFRPSTRRRCRPSARRR